MNIPWNPIDMDATYNSIHVGIVIDLPTITGPHGTCLLTKNGYLATNVPAWKLQAGGWSAGGGTWRWVGFGAWASWCR